MESDSANALSLLTWTLSYGEVSLSLSHSINSSKVLSSSFKVEFCHLGRLANSMLEGPLLGVMVKAWIA